ncbi:hypothetical protein HK405_008746, partial [Cladochytrium tenue]
TQRDLYAKALLIEHGLASIQCPRPRPPAMPPSIGSVPDRWQALVHDNRLSEDVTVSLITAGLVDSIGFPLITEFATARGSLRTLQALFPLPGLPLGPSATLFATQAAALPDTIIQCCLLDRALLIEHLAQFIHSHRIAGSFDVEVEGEQPRWRHLQSLSTGTVLAAKNNCVETLRALLLPPTPTPMQDHHTPIDKPVIRAAEFTTNEDPTCECCHVHANTNHGAALAWAARMGNIEIVRLLLDYGADATAQDALAVLWAAEYGQLDSLRALLGHLGERDAQSGVQPGSPTSLVSICVHAQDDYCVRWAAARGHVHVVQELLRRHAARVDAMDGFALRHAVRFGHAPMVRLLCGEGRADPRAAGGEALRWARAAGDADIAAVVEDRLRELCGDAASLPGSPV